MYAEGLSESLGFGHKGSNINSLHVKPCVPTRAASRRGLAKRHCQSFFHAPPGRVSRLARLAYFEPADG